MDNTYHYIVFYGDDTAFDVASAIEGKRKAGYNVVVNTVEDSHGRAGVLLECVPEPAQIMYTVDEIPRIPFPWRK